MEQQLIAFLLWSKQKAYGGLWLTWLDVENELVALSSDAGALQGPFLLRETATAFRFVF